jgi:hypothetical protein
MKFRPAPKSKLEYLLDITGRMGLQDVDQNMPGQIAGYQQPQISSLSASFYRVDEVRQ